MLEKDPATPTKVRLATTTPWAPLCRLPMPPYATFELEPRTRWMVGPSVCYPMDPENDSPGPSTLETSKSARAFHAPLILSVRSPRQERMSFRTLKGNIHRWRRDVNGKPTVVAQFAVAALYERRPAVPSCVRAGFVRRLEYLHFVPLWAVKSSLIF